METEQKKPIDDYTTAYSLYEEGILPKTFIEKIESSKSCSTTNLTQLINAFTLVKQRVMYELTQPAGESNSEY